MSIYLRHTTLAYFGIGSFAQVILDTLPDSLVRVSVILLLHSLVIYIGYLLVWKLARRLSSPSKCEEGHSGQR